MHTGSNIFLIIEDEKIYSEVGPRFNTLREWCTLRTTKLFGEKKMKAQINQRKPLKVRRLGSPSPRKSPPISQPRFTVSSN